MAKDPDKTAKTLEDWQVCKKSTSYSIHSRRCFVTGEYCSKQTNVHKERRKLHNADNKSINAFVIMNFSEMSDVVYQWRLLSFIESLKQYLWLNTQTNEIACTGTVLKREAATAALRERYEEPQPMREFLRKLSLRIAGEIPTSESLKAPGTVLNLHNGSKAKKVLYSLGVAYCGMEDDDQKDLTARELLRELCEVVSDGEVGAGVLVQTLYRALAEVGGVENNYEPYHAELDEEALGELLRTLGADAKTEEMKSTEILKELHDRITALIRQVESGKLVKAVLQERAEDQEQDPLLLKKILMELGGDTLRRVLEALVEWEKNDLRNTYDADKVDRLLAALDQTISELSGRAKDQENDAESLRSGSTAAVGAFRSALELDAHAAQLLEMVCLKKVARQQTQLSEKSVREVLASLGEDMLRAIPDRLDALMLCRIYDEAVRKVLGEWVAVEKINVLRSDSNPASNYVICNRICQQIQIADLVIVDVSTENTNVFYEFGLASAFGKLILPICYSESFYAADKKIDLAGLNKNYAKNIKHHLGFHSWRKKLFEYYGIRYRREQSNTEYAKYEDVTAKDSPFDDRQYGMFPYTDKIGGERIGKTLYDRLGGSYNASKIDGKRHYNTVVVYTMDSFLNRDEAGQCIVNYYNNIIKQLRLERCFCGDRVGILGQSNSILDDHKDAQRRADLMYNVSDIILIGMNQATFLAQQKKFKTDDYMPSRDETELASAELIGRSAKAHIENRCIPAYPDNPVYVRQYEQGVQKGILDKKQLEKKRDENGFDFEHFFCLFHVMLYTLKYANEIVVDISRNSLQALFWLGVAHGSDVHAISVRHIPTQRDLDKQDQINPQNERNIFDVAGLWTAILESNNMESFYQQLAQVQLGIEQRAKLMLDNMIYYENSACEQLYQPSPFRKRNDSREDPRLKAITDLLLAKSQTESLLLESYYRERFWRHMLRYNHLNIYIPPNHEDRDRDGEPKLTVAKWDVDAMDKLSHYLSKRKVIGQYHQEMSNEYLYSCGAPKENFIAIGGELDAMKKEAAAGGGSAMIRALPQYVAERLKDYEDEADHEKGYNVLRMLDTQKPAEGMPETGCPDSGSPEYRGFRTLLGKAEADVYAQFPRSGCIDCMNNGEPQTGCANAILCNQPLSPDCQIKDRGTTTYYQLAQLLLWRDVEEQLESDVKFRVSLVGVSGPATLALTTLLIDDEQKEALLNPDGADSARQLRLPLNSLQRRIRLVFMERFSETLDDVLSRSQGTYTEAVRYAAQLYLSTVLYQYFLPFLSLADEDRICNGLHAYVTAPGNPAPFDHKTKGKDGGEITYGDAVEEALRRVVHNLRGVEALYRVKVQINGKDSDTRRVLDIESVEQSSSSDSVKGVSCLFTDKLNVKKTKKKT